jgi:hypothetical protein
VSEIVLYAFIFLIGQIVGVKVALWLIDHSHIR